MLRLSYCIRVSEARRAEEFRLSPFPRSRINRPIGPKVGLKANFLTAYSSYLSMRDDKRAREIVC